MTLRLSKVFGRDASFNYQLHYNIICITPFKTKLSGQESANLFKKVQEADQILFSTRLA
jgi:hypothetical protein